ncbi:MAG: site-2 protease family protein [Bacilli bacterium]|nr:site-2 protease family protein [Bacilli bacterium]
MVILYILIFVLCLSTLIIVHELGHLIMAKVFHVYCFEYAIGFGPKIFSKKKDNWETRISIRAIPFGGYVSMYGEGVELPEGVESIPEERSLTGIKKWKRAIILVAGVTMNSILALLVFFIVNSCFPVTDYFLREVTISETSPFKGQLQTGDVLRFEEDEEENLLIYDDSYYVIDKSAVVSYNNGDPDKEAAILFSPAIKSNKQLDWSYFIEIRLLDENHEISENKLVYNQFVNAISFQVGVYQGKDDNDKPIWLEKTLDLTLKEEEGLYVLPELGISLTTDTYYLKGKAFGKTFSDFGESSIVIVKALGSLFVSQEARNSVGGIIAIGFESTNILKNFGIAQFLRVWALVSVNLAVVNLLPFPGLDGWQLLVTAVEGISRKKIPDKVKNIVSFIGLALLMALMVAIVIKDIMTYII